MKNRIIIGVIALATLMSVSTTFAYTNCSDATGENRYVDYNYRGGIAPTPTTVIDDVKIYLDGQLVSESTLQSNGVKSQGGWAAYFSADTKTVLNTVNNWTQDYSIQVSINPTHTLPPSRVFWMVCHQDNTPVP